MVKISSRVRHPFAGSGFLDILFRNGGKEKSGAICALACLFRRMSN